MPEATSFYLLLVYKSVTPIFCLSWFEFHFPLKECHLLLKDPREVFELKHSKASWGSGTRNSRHKDPGGLVAISLLPLGHSPFFLCQQTSSFFSPMFTISRRWPLSQCLDPKPRFMGERIHLTQAEPHVYLWCNNYRQRSRKCVLTTWQLDSFRVSDPRESKGKPYTFYDAASETIYHNVYKNPVGHTGQSIHYGTGVDKGKLLGSKNHWVPSWWLSHTTR